jgi:methionine synthase II (cobalamin-independent)
MDLRQKVSRRILVTNFYRTEVIGSLLRPEYLKQARKDWQAGSMPTREFQTHRGPCD